MVVVGYVPTIPIKEGMLVYCVAAQVLQIRFSGFPLTTNSVMDLLQLIQSTCVVSVIVVMRYQDLILIPVSHNSWNYQFPLVSKLPVETLRLRPWTVYIEFCILTNMHLSTLYGQPAITFTQWYVITVGASFKLAQKW
jgi:hypothetical protein